MTAVTVKACCRPCAMVSALKDHASFCAVLADAQLLMCLQGTSRPCHGMDLWNWYWLEVIDYASAVCVAHPGHKAHLYRVGGLPLRPF